MDNINLFCVNRCVFLKSMRTSILLVSGWISHVYAPPHSVCLHSQHLERLLMDLLPGEEGLLDGIQVYGVRGSMIYSLLCPNWTG